jgi:hypothetical protein
VMAAPSAMAAALGADDVAALDKVGARRTH